MERLALALESEVELGLVSNLFCLEKPDGELRQIIDRRPRNAIESPPPKDTPKMGHASVFLGLLVPKQGCIRLCVDDLRNYYHEFQVSSERALSTPVGPLWFARDFLGSKALAALQLRRPDVRINPSARVYTCFAGLAMGDHWAPAIAQVAHEQLLRKAGALREDEHLRLGDDKLSLQVFPQHVPANKPDIRPLERDLQACSLASKAYTASGLESHPKKCLRRASEFKAWGAHFDGDAAVVSMDRSKLVCLCLEMARLRTPAAEGFGTLGFCFAI